METVKREIILCIYYAYNIPHIHNICAALDLRRSGVGDEIFI